MDPILVSVIIPAYRQAQYVGDAIQSILNQSYPHFEIIVVDDASPDNTSDITKSFSDARIKLIVHSANLGLSAARNSGILAATGKFLALLDADDMFHPDKLQLHVEFLRNHPEVGVTYNARFELNHSDTTIREIWRPPLTVHLRDLVLGFPFTPSDMVVRQEWLSKAGLFDPRVGSAEDTDLPCRLALAGCRFAGIDRALNYRRYHSGRGRRNLRGRLNDISRVLETVFADPRCPNDVLAIRNTSIKSHLMSVMSLALIQEETELGQELVLELVKIDPSVTKGRPCKLLEFLITESIADENLDHGVILQKILAQLPKEMSWLSEQYDWAVAQGYLRRAIRATIWDRFDQGKSHFECALALNAQVDGEMLRSTAHHLLDCEINLGSVAAQLAIMRLSNYLDKFGGRRNSGIFKGSYWASNAFRKYCAGEHRRVPGSVVKAWINDPSYLANRGLLSILIRSSIGVVRQQAYR